MTASESARLCTATKYMSIPFCSIVLPGIVALFLFSQEFLKTFDGDRRPSHPPYIQHLSQPLSPSLHPLPCSVPQAPPKEEEEEEPQSQTRAERGNSVKREQRAASNLERKLERRRSEHTPLPLTRKRAGKKYSPPSCYQGKNYNSKLAASIPPPPFSWEIPLRRKSNLHCEFLFAVRPSLPPSRLDLPCTVV